MSTNLSPGPTATRATVSREDAIDRVERPVTADRLVGEFRDLGVGAGDTLLVHSSLSALGWVCVDATTVVDALMSTVTESGTLVVPTHSPQYSDPERWHRPPIPDDWVPTVIEERPPYRPRVTPSRGVGAIPECLRTYPRAHRSRHPVMSFTAWGRDAASIVADHAYDFGLGETSPLAEVYDRSGQVLLLGVDHDVNTSLHLAEHRAEYPDKETVSYRVPVLEGGQRRLREIDELETDTGDFQEVGSAFEEDHEVRIGSVGAATGRLLDQPALVDFAVEWFGRNR